MKFKYSDLNRKERDAFFATKKELAKLYADSKRADAILVAEERHLKRLAYLDRQIQTAEVKTERARIFEALKLFDATQYIADASETELKYAAAINELEPIDRLIIIDHFMNGVPYWKLGKKIGYAERAVRYHADLAILKLAGGVKI